MTLPLENLLAQNLLSQVSPRKLSPMQSTLVNHIIWNSRCQFVASQSVLPTGWKTDRWNDSEGFLHSAEGRQFILLIKQHAEPF